MFSAAPEASRCSGGAGAVLGQSSRRSRPGWRRESSSAAESARGTRAASAERINGELAGSARRRDRVLTLSAERSEVGAAATRTNCLIGVILTMLLAVTLLPAAGLVPAFADEPAQRPAVTGGDVALEGGTDAGTVAGQARDDGMVVADGLVYTAADGGLMLVGFDGADISEDIVVPASVLVDGTETPVVAIDIAEGSVTESTLSLTLPQTINSVDTAALAAAFPNLASVEVAAPKASSAPVAAGAAAMKAAYSSFAGILYKNVRDAPESSATATGFAKEFIWAPPATVVARIPVECVSIAPGAFADVKDLKTVVCFGVMGEIPQARKAEDGTVTTGAFTDEQIATVNVIVPQTGTVVPNGEHISASVAVTDHSTMDIKREAWWKAGFASDRITLGEVYGSTTNTLPVNEEGVLEMAEAEVAYAPETTQNSSSRKAGIEPPESAIPTPVPDDDELDPSESGLAFTHLADMTLSVSWKGDPTATPAHIDIPAYATINGVTYPVTEIAPHAFEGAVFLESVTIPEGVTAIGESAFADCANLAGVTFPTTLKTAAATAFDGAAVPAAILPAIWSAQAAVLAVSTDSAEPQPRVALSTFDQKNGDRASKDAVATADPVDSAASEADALVETKETNALLRDNELTKSDDTISPFFSFANTSTTFACDFVYVTDGGLGSVPCAPATVSSPWNVTYTRSDADRFTITYLGSANLDLVTFLADQSGQLAITLYSGSTPVGSCHVALEGDCAVRDIANHGRSSYRLMCETRILDGSFPPDAKIRPSVIPGLAASKITSGTFSVDRIPDLDAAKITSGTFGVDRIPSLSAAKITSGTFSMDRIPDLDAAKITSGAFDPARIADGAITSEKIASGAVTTVGLAKNAVTTAKIVDAAIDKYKLANDAVISAKIADGEVKSVDLADDAVISAKIADGEVKSVDLADDAVTTSKISNNAVVNTKIAENAIDSAKIADGTVAAADLANGSVTTNKLGADAVTSAKIANGAVATDDLADGSVTDDKLAVKFGTIAYSGLDGADSSVYPTSYRQGGTPALPVPRKAGSEFLGWTWGGQTTPTTDANVIKGAFAGSGTVALTANWRAASTGYFFSTEAPFSKDAGNQSFTLAVRLSDAAGTLLKASFQNDNEALFPDGAAVSFAIGNALGSDGALASALMEASGFSAAGGSPVPLARLGDQSWGVYVKATVPGSAAGEVAGSFSDGSYVARFVKLDYELS